MDRAFSQINFSSNFSDIDQEFVVSELKKAYWSSDRSRETILLGLSHSFCFSCFNESGKQIAFLRVITDYATFFYLCDVIVTESERGKGVGTQMLTELFGLPQFKKAKWMLRTKDAHSLYKKFGFEKTFRPERYMEKMA